MLYDRIVDDKDVGRKIWKICTAFNNDLYSVERFVRRWMIRSAMDDLYKFESFGLRLIIDYELFNECQVCLFEKILWNIFHKPLGWFFPDMKISRIFGPAPRNWSYKDVSDHSTGNYYLLLLMYFPGISNNFLNKSDAPLFDMM